MMKRIIWVTLNEIVSSDRHTEWENVVAKLQNNAMLKPDGGETFHTDKITTNANEAPMRAVRLSVISIMTSPEI